MIGRPFANLFFQPPSSNEGGPVLSHESLDAAGFPRALTHQERLDRIGYQDAIPEEFCDAIDLEIMDNPRKLGWTVIDVRNQDRFKKTEIITESAQDTADQSAVFYYVNPLVMSQKTDPPVVLDKLQEQIRQFVLEKEAEFNIKNLTEQKEMQFVVNRSLQEAIILEIRAKTENPSSSAKTLEELITELERLEKEEKSWLLGGKVESRQAKDDGAERAPRPHMLARHNFRLAFFAKPSLKGLLSLIDSKKEETACISAAALPARHDKD